MLASMKRQSMHRESAVAALAYGGDMALAVDAYRTRALIRLTKRSAEQTSSGA